MRVPVPPLCSHGRFESPRRGPREQTALQINVLLLRPYRSLLHQISMVIAALFQIGHVVWIKDRQCHRKKKRVKSHGKLFEVSLTPINPPSPPHAPRPTVGQRRNAVQRFCRMSRKGTKDRKITLFLINNVVCDLWWGLAAANKRNCYLLFENGIAAA